MISRKSLFGAILSGLAMAALVPQARADFILTISEGSTTVTIDQATSALTNPSVTGSLGGGFAVANGHGFTLINVTVGDYNISTDAATTNAPGTTFGIINLTNTTISLLNANPTAPLSLNLRTTTSPSSYGAFTAPKSGAGTLQSAIQGQDANKIGFSVTYQSSMNGTVAGAQQSLASNAGDSFNPGNNTQFTPVTVTTPYTLAALTTIRFASGAAAGSEISNVSGTTQVVSPAPAGLLLALSGVPGLCLGYLLRRRQVSPEGAA
jgi:hypothetical protein